MIDFVIYDTHCLKKIGSVKANTPEEAIQEAKFVFKEPSPVVCLLSTRGGLSILKSRREESARLYEMEKLRD